MCVGGVWAFDKPEASATDLRERPAEQLRLKHGATVTVVAQTREWLKVRRVDRIFRGIAGLHFRWQLVKA